MPSKQPQASTQAQRRATTALELEEFARRLHAAMQAMNWTQSELAKAAFGCKKDYRGVIVPQKRDQVSAYIHGKRLPDEANLKLLCKALKLKPTDLLPERSKALIDRNKPSLQTTMEPDGRMRIRLDQAFDPVLGAQLILAITQASERAAA